MTHDELIAALPGESVEVIRLAGFVLVPRLWRDRAMEAFSEKGKLEERMDRAAEQDADRIKAIKAANDAAAQADAAKHRSEEAARVRTDFDRYFAKGTAMYCPHGWRWDDGCPHC